MPVTDAGAVMDEAIALDPVGDTHAALRGGLTIGQATAWRALMLDAIAAGRWQWDLSGVTDCDSAGVQLLLAARHSVAEQGAALQLAAASAAARASLARYGLDHALAD